MASDPISCGSLSIDGFVGASGDSAKTGGDLFSMGAGGSTIAIACCGARRASAERTFRIGSSSPIAVRAASKTPGVSTSRSQAARPSITSLRPRRQNNERVGAGHSAGEARPS